MLVGVRGTGAGGPVVALVSSAGGLDALARVLSPLPPGYPAAVIALQHLDPIRASGLAAILAHRAQLPVRFAEQGTELTPGVVVVAPPGLHTLVLPDRTLRLIVSGAAPPSRPSADLLLTTLAISVGAAAIAVVLSGGGHDGATGATAVHDLGGTVIAADEHSSEQFSMPHATIGRADAVDHVAGVDQIAGLLQSLVVARS